MKSKTRTMLTIAVTLLVISGLTDLAVCQDSKTTEVTKEAEKETAKTPVDKNACDFANIEFTFYSDSKCEKKMDKFSEEFNKTFHDKTKNKFTPTNECQEVDVEGNGEKKWTKWICDEEQIKFVVMKDPNPITDPASSKFQCSQEDDCPDCGIMDY